MHWLTRLAGGLRTLRRRRSIEFDLDDELRFHVEMETEANLRRGLDADAARRAAIKTLGGLPQVRAATRSVWRLPWVEALLRDLHFAGRLVRRRPAFAAAVIVPLAVGIGATTTAFSAVEGMLLRPLVYAEPERVMTVWETDVEQGGSRLEVSPGNFVDWRERNHTFDVMALAVPDGAELETSPDLPREYLSTWQVTDGFFEALGVGPLLGELPSAEHFLEGAEPVVVVSHDVWIKRWGGESSAIGTTLLLDDEPVRLVAVMPPGFEYPPGRGVWIPGALPEYHLDLRAASFTQAVGRLAQGVSAGEAGADLARISAALAREHPETNQGIGVELLPLPDRLLGEARPILWLVLTGVALLLVVTCSNVASLLLARGATRAREVAVRRALGANRRRLARQLFTETLVLCLIAGALGLVLALAGARAVVALAPADLPRLDQVRPGVGAGAFTFALTGVVALLAGLLPAVRGARSDLRGPAEEGATHTGSRQRWRLQGALVAGQIAIALLLLIGAGLLLRSFGELLARDLGYEPRNRLHVQLFFWNRFDGPEQRSAFLAAALERLRATPGVAGAAAVSWLPLQPNGVDPRDELLIHGRPRSSHGAASYVYPVAATPGYFRVADLPLVAGRAFGPADRADGKRVAIVDEETVRRYWPGESPIGRRIDFGVMSAPRDWEIVGIVGSIRPTGFESEPRPQVYVPYEQARIGTMTLVAQTAGRAEELLPGARQAVWDADPHQVIYDDGTLEDLLGGSLARRRFAVLLVAALAGVALLVALLGVYALVAFAVAQRIRELGIRKVLGAREADLLRIPFRWASRWAAAGLAGGVLLALAGTHLLAAWLVEVEPGDPGTYVGVGVLVALASALAAYLPARRVAGADPLAALRAD